MNENSPTRAKAKRDSWQTVPMPESRERLPFEREFTQEEYKKISLGLIPQQMEDKWFIFLEDNQLFFHRSWTGHCMYQLQLEKREQGYSVTEAWVNRDRGQYRNFDNEYDATLLSFLIDNLLLGKSTPFPQPNRLPENLPKGVYQHHVAGTAYSETIIPTRIPLIERLKRFFRNLRH